MSLTKKLLSIIILCIALAGNAEAQRLQFARFDTCPLENGQSIQDCRIGYRTAGSLNVDRSNAVLFPTWFTGQTADLTQYAAPGQMADSTKHFVIFVDAFGNGVSSSPSNSNTQPEDRFPRVSIRDMVDAQHRLVTEVLGLDHLHAVMGISMGGMQTFEWMTRYPDFIDKAVPIVGTTHMTPYDRMLWQAELQMIELTDDDPKQLQRAMRTVATIQARNLRTPTQIAQMDSAAFQKFFSSSLKSTNQLNPYDRAAQLRAMLHHNIATPLGGDMEAAVDTVSANVLVVVATHDHMVNPLPALRFAEMIGADTLELTSNCGHLAPGCQMGLLRLTVDGFLSP